MFENVKREHILKAIAEFNRSGFPDGFGPSVSYDAINKGKRYPPPTIMAYAYRFAEGRLLEPGFKVGKGTECFSALEREGFQIREKNRIRELVTEFLDQSKTDNLKTKHYLKSYKSLKLKVSFGTGNTARIPWIAFLKSPNKVQDGIYPVILYYKDLETLILSYGLSETKESQYSWGNGENQTIETWFLQNHGKKPERYGKSKIKSIYNVNAIDYISLEKDLNSLIEEYNAINFENYVNEDEAKYRENTMDKYLNEFALVADDWFQKQEWLEKRFNFFKDFFITEKIKQYSWSDFQELKTNLHSFTSMPLAGANALGNPNLPIERYREIFSYIISQKHDIATTINNLFEKYNGDFYLPYFGESTVTELIQYAFPEKYIVYNTRTENALNLLGIKFKNIRGEKIGEKFKRFNDLVTTVTERYLEIVEQRTQTTPQLELDQFFSWLYEAKKLDKPVKDLLAKYKTRIRTHQLKNEKYKWQFIEKNKGKLDLSAASLIDEIKSIKWNNLIYHNSISVLEHVAEKYSENLRNLFSNLYDENIALEERMRKWEKDFLKVYRNINQEHQHHQDERAVSVYLTLKHPDLYTFYKNSYYIKFCELLKEKPKSKGKKYLHYLELIHLITDKYISKDSELQNLVQSYIPEYYKGNKDLLLAQDILYQILDQSKVSTRENDFEIAMGKFSQEELSEYFSFLFNFIDTYSIKEGDDRILYSTSGNNLSVTIGQRYAWVLRHDDARGKFGVLSRGKINQASEPFNKNIDDEQYFTLSNRFDPTSQNKEQIFSGFESQLEKTVKSGFRKFNDNDFEKSLFDNEFRLRFEKLKKKNSMEPKNVILYGPPGTGKTYSLKTKFFPLYTTNETSISSEQYFESVVKECSWWEVIAIALIQLGTSKVNDIFQHKWVQKKADLSNSNSIKPTLWGQLQSHTIEECNYVNVKSKQQPLIFNKTEDSSWEVLKNKVDNEVPELYELIDKVENFNPSPDKEIKRFTFVTFHQSFSYEDFIEGIKPIMPDNSEMSAELGYKIEDGIFKEICKDAELDPTNRYAIFIDEINRGNVSAIFGELITLIEKDKRRGEINEMSIELPYSKKKFSVPSNLDIYGTMNTADRSVEALDTALRRRFEFKEMMPDYQVIEDEVISGIKLSKVLKVINRRIEMLIDRDHTIGHSYFVNVDSTAKLVNAFNNKILPLLQEYFYGDYGKIGLVLGNGFVKEKGNKKLKFSSFKYEGKEDFVMPTYELTPISSSNILSAIEQLLESDKN